ncbi:MAG TPA: rod shape-determining protein [Bryobacteraceae bacterium]|nr:rod shape-determining protein [Bryobacteraceae bacterium]
MIGFASGRVGLDPGSANTLMYVEGRGVAVNEPSLVTVRASTGDIEAVGREAEAGLGRTPTKFRTERPIRGGIITDLKLFEGMLGRFLRQAHILGSLHRLKVVAAVPSGTTEVDRRAAVESLRNAGATCVWIVEQALAAAWGAGLPVDESRGRMVVNIGAGVTDIAVLSLGSIVHARSIRVAGNEMDAAIMAYVRSAHQLAIGERTAERLKIEIGSALPGPEERTLRIKGRCAARGIPREAAIRDGEIRDALSAPVQRIVNALREALEEVPPELSADLVETGIVLTGGCALLRNLDRCISNACGLPVRVAGNPLACVILGLAHQLNCLRPRDWRRFGNVA